MMPVGWTRLRVGHDRKWGKLRQWQRWVTRGPLRSRGPRGRIGAAMAPSLLAELLGESPGIVAVRETAARLLQRQAERGRLAPVLIQGETGVGKGLLARALHRAGPRSSGPFVDVNCAAIPETLLEAELFGYERGAFTDARHPKAGLFQTAHHGTIFLDEVGLLPEGLQAKLLKALEDRAVRRLGSTRSEPVDVWIVTASNEDLVEAIRTRRFREDLYHRLAVVTLTLPPLRARGDDVRPAGRALPRARVRGVRSASQIAHGRCARRASRLRVARKHPGAGQRDGAGRAPLRGCAGRDRGARTAVAGARCGRPPGARPGGLADPRRRPGQRGAGAPRRGAPRDGRERHARRRAARNLPRHPALPHGEARARAEGDASAPGARSRAPARAGRAGRLVLTQPRPRPAPRPAAETAGAPGCSLGGSPARIPPKHPRPAGRDRSRIQPEPRLRDPGREGPDVRRTHRGDEPDRHRRGVRVRADRGRSAARRTGRRGGPQGGGPRRGQRGAAHRRPLEHRRPAGARRVLPRGRPGRPGGQARGLDRPRHPPRAGRAGRDPRGGGRGGVPGPGLRSHRARRRSGGCRRRAPARRDGAPQRRARAARARVRGSGPRARPPLEPPRGRPAWPRPGRRAPRRGRDREIAPAPRVPRAAPRRARAAGHLPGGTLPVLRQRHPVLPDHGHPAGELPRLRG